MKGERRKKKTRKRDFGNGKKWDSGQEWPVASLSHFPRTSGCLAWMEEEGSGSGQDRPKGCNLFDWPTAAALTQLVGAGQEGGLTVSAALV